MKREYEERSVHKTEAWKPARKLPDARQDKQRSSTREKGHSATRQKPSITENTPLRSHSGAPPDTVKPKN